MTNVREERPLAQSDGVAGALAPRQAVDPEPLRAAERFYHPELDVLRFVAFAFVLLLHAGPKDVAQWTALGVPEEVARWATSAILSGAYGVDLFFALSSYLITELLIREWHKRGKLDVKSFYIRRALRIWPLYFFFLGLTILVVPRLLPDEHLPSAHLWAFLLFGANWSAAILGFPNSVAGPLWSVSIEEQFYIVWPLLLAAIGVRRILPAALVMIGIAGVVKLGLVAAAVDTRVLWTVTFARLEPIAIGAMIAVLLRGGVPTLGGTRRAALFAGGLFVWVAGTRYSPGGWANLILYPAVAAGAGAMLLATLRADTAGSLFGSPVLVYLGRISYGLYVYHRLALDLVRHWLGEATTLQPWFAFLLVPLMTLAFTIALAAVSFRFVEEPFLRLKRRFTHVRSRD